MISNAHTKENQLNTQKQQAVISKNFKAAKLYSDQINDLKTLVQKSESTLIESTDKLDSFEHEIIDLNTLISHSNGVLEETKNSLSDIDYTFFESSKLLFDQLFAISPFASKYLKND